MKAQRHWVATELASAVLKLSLSRAARCCALPVNNGAVSDALQPFVVRRRTSQLSQVVVRLWDDRSIAAFTGHLAGILSGPQAPLGAVSRWHWEAALACWIRTATPDAELLRCGG